MIKKIFYNAEEMTKEERNELTKFFRKQQESQLKRDKLLPNPIAVNPIYCNAYCNGYMNALLHVAKILEEGVAFK